MSINIEAVNERRRIRVENSRKRAQKSDRLKDEGNQAFKRGDYKKAARKYASAIEQCGPKAVLFSNLAAALSKLELWIDVEWAATNALKLEPTMTKARFRRALARKALKRWEAATLDLEGIVDHDPSSCPEARNELQAVRELWHNDAFSDHQDSDDDYFIFGEREWPNYHEDPFVYEADSDTEDCLHKGNGVACRSYNHGGCSRGEQCTFSHAPDDKSVRDYLGRNVCLHYLLGDCKFGDSICIYSHDDRYLPPPEWWKDPAAVERARTLVTGMEGTFLSPAEYELFLHMHPNGQKLGKGPLRKLLNARLQKAVERADAAKSTEVPQPPAKQSTVGVAPSKTRFILLVSLQNESYFKDINSHMLAGLEAKRRVVQAFNPACALEMLSSSDLDGVLITDAGIAKRNAAFLLRQLVNYAKSGGVVVVGCMFSGNIAGNDFEKFFRNFGLNWERGSYHRTTFYSNPANKVVAVNPSLAPFYSMKALHADGISSDMALYSPTAASVLQSLVFAPRQIQNLREAPVVMAKVEKGYVGYVGDVNSEKESTNVYLALLGLLDAPLPSPETPANRVPASKESTTSAASNNIPQPKAGPSTPKPPATISVPMPSKSSPLVIALLDGSTSHFTKTYSRQISLIRSKTKVEMIYTCAELENRLTSGTASAVYLADGGIFKAGNSTRLLPKLVEYVKAGGNLVAAGLFPSMLNQPGSKLFFSAFGQTWTTGSYKREVYELIPSTELAKKNPTLAEAYSMKSLNLKDIDLEVPVYLVSPDDENDDSDYYGSGGDVLDAPIVRARISRGALGYIGDVAGEPETDSVLLSMFGLLHPEKASSTPTRKSRNFVLFLSFLDRKDEEKMYGLLLKRLEQKIEVVRGLSIERMSDLVSSPDLTTVFIGSSSIAQPDNAYLLSRLVAFTNEAGGTVIFLQSFARQITMPECRPFFLDAWGLDWTGYLRDYGVENVKLNDSNGWVAAHSHPLPSTPDLFSEHCLGASNPKHLVYVPKRPRKPQWDPEHAFYAAPVLYADVGEKGHVGYVSMSPQGDYERLVLAMAGL